MSSASIPLREIMMPKSPTLPKANDGPRFFTTVFAPKALPL